MVAAAMLETVARRVDAPSGVAKGAIHELTPLQVQDPAVRAIPMHELLGDRIVLG